MITLLFLTLKVKSKNSPPTGLKSCIFLSKLTKTSLINLIITTLFTKLIVRIVKQLILDGSQVNNLHNGTQETNAQHRKRFIYDSSTQR